jgi:hypothetical protein
MSEGADRADRVAEINREIVAILAGDAPRVDEQGRDRYFELISELARLTEGTRKYAGQAGG